MRQSLRLACALSALSLAPSAQFNFDVWVVDDNGGPGVDFTDLQPAANAASAGDLILVKDGFYNGFSVVAKGLRVVAEDGANVEVSGLIHVRQTNSLNQTLLQGLSSGCAPEGLRIHIEDCAGAVLIEDCELGSWGCPGGAFVAPPGVDGRAIYFESSARQAVVRTSAVGLGGQDDSDGYDGLHSEASISQIWNSTLVGGKGGQGTVPGPAGQGGAGLHASNFDLWESGSTLRGGDGGSGGPVAGGCAQGGDGGAGLFIDGQFSLVERHNENALGSLGGFSSCGATGAGGPAALQTGGTSMNVVAPGGTYRASSPVREGLTTAIDVTGTPGDLVILLAESAMLQLPSLGTPYIGPSLVDLSTAIVQTLGVLPAGGNLNLNLGVGMVPAGFEHVVYFTQALWVRSPTEIAFGPGSAVAVLDSAF